MYECIFTQNKEISIDNIPIIKVNLIGLNFSDKCVIYPLRVRKIVGSVLGLATGYPWLKLRDFSHNLKEDIEAYLKKSQIRSFQ
jgi:hypothetical protein